MKNIRFQVSDRIYAKVRKLNHKKKYRLGRALRRTVNAIIRV